jgi:hypothetical protein
VGDPIVFFQLECLNLLARVIADRMISFYGGLIPTPFKTAENFLLSNLFLAMLDQLRVDQESFGDSGGKLRI